MLAYVGRIHDLKDLKDRIYIFGFQAVLVEFSNQSFDPKAHNLSMTGL